jgi:hypothetical protein
MTKEKLNGHAEPQVSEHEDADLDADDALSEEETGVVATVAAVGVVGVGVAMFEAALLPGLALGVVAMLAPKMMPQIGEALSPMFKSTVRGVYKLGRKTKELVHEANEHVQDIVAEVDAEAKGAAAAMKGAAHDPHA